MSTLTLASLPTPLRTLAASSSAWSDARWDATDGLLHLTSNDAPQPAAIIRESVWYSLGLLLRDSPGDLDRAVKTLAAVLPHQWDAAGMPYHGTFARYVGEPTPPGLDAVMWRQYDPNWRQFIGTTLAIIVTDYADRLPRELLDGMERAISLAVEGEPPDRCPPWYANIALMKAGLLAWAGRYFDRADWRTEAEQVARAVYNLFVQHDSFYEYNSPTYYGVNLYALGFWRRYSGAPLLQELGAHMEAALWRDIATLYHPGLCNVCGPFMRAYGMDMTGYASLLGMCVWGVVGQADAPFPDPRQPFEHDADFVMGPCLAAVGMEPPVDVAPMLTAFNAERRVDRLIATEPARRVTAWLGATVMAGAEAVDPSGLEANDERVVWIGRLGRQYHPLTLHWRTGNGDVGTLRLLARRPVNATVDGACITLAQVHQHEQPTWEFVIGLPVGSAAPQVDIGQWVLDGLTLAVTGAVAAPQVSSSDDGLHLTLPATPLQFDLKT